MIKLPNPNQPTGFNITRITQASCIVLLRLYGLGYE